MGTDFVAQPVPADFDVKHSAKPIRRIAARIDRVCFLHRDLPIHGVDRPEASLRRRSVDAPPRKHSLAAAPSSARRCIRKPL
jgi:hypothetical protein